MFVWDCIQHPIDNSLHGCTPERNLDATSVRQVRQYWGPYSTHSND
jgi:hypothetical protein